MPLFEGLHDIRDVRLLDGFVAVKTDLTLNDGLVQPREQQLALTIFGENTPQVGLEVCLDFGSDHPAQEGRPGLVILTYTDVTPAKIIIVCGFNHFTRCLNRFKCQGRIKNHVAQVVSTHFIPARKEWRDHLCRPLLALLVIKVILNNTPEMTAYNLSCVRINEQSAQMRFLYFTRFLNIAQPLVLEGLFRCKPLGRVSLQNPLHEVLCGWRDASP